MVTVANEPAEPLTEAGLSEIDAGWPCGVRVSCDCTLAPFQLAVMLARVFAATMFVGIPTETDAFPAGTVARAGGIADAESLERSTTAPPAGAWPLSITIAPAVAPPLMVEGESVIDLSDGGSTLNCTVADPELSVAVSVTGVADVTWPACIWNCIHAVLPGMVIVAGTATAAGFELERLIIEPDAGAAPLSCTCTHVVLPL